MNRLNKLTALFISVITVMFVLSVSAVAAVRPVKPSFLKAVTVKADSVELKWDKSLAADSYTVYVKKDGKWKSIKSTQERSYTVKKLDAAASYTFAVRSVNKSGGKSYYSKDYTTLKVKTKGVSKTALSAEGGVGTVKLSWNKVAGASGYNIYRKSNGEWKFVKKLTSASTVSYTVRELKYNTTYYFAVRPYSNGNGKRVFGAYSDTVKAKTLRANKVSVNYTLNQDNSLTLRWSKAEGVTGYRVYRYSAGEWKTLLTVNSPDTLETVIASLKSDTKYMYRVRAFAKLAEKTVWYVPSSTLTIVTDPAESDLKLTRTKKLKEKLEGKAFTLSYTTESNYGETPVTVSKSGSKYRLDTTVNATKYALLNTSGKTYVLLSKKKAYIEIPEYLSESFSVKASVEDLVPGSKWKGKVTIETFDGKKAVCESYTNSYKTKTLKYYYKAGELIGIEECGSKNKLEEKAVVTSFKTSASSSQFKIPSGYKKVSYT